MRYANFVIKLTISENLEEEKTEDSKFLQIF